jgi:hypothetical protein
MFDVKRRQFITLLASTAVTWPVTARAQQTERVRRVGVLLSVAADGPDGQPRLAAFLKRLQELGWTDGHNVRIDVRWGAGEAERTRKYVAELVALGGHSGQWRPPGRGVAAGHQHCADHICDGRRPCRRGLCRELGSPRPQHDRVYFV